MLTVSVHGIKLRAKVGLYPKEKIHGNDFEIDVDVMINTSAIQSLPMIDYVVINELVHEAFNTPTDLLETVITTIHQAIKKQFALAEKVRIAIRKLHPPMKGVVGYAQVCFEG
jgi:dihydroneopterin aldolase